MAPWILILCSVVGGLRAQDAAVAQEQISMEDCCKDGHQRGSDNQDCTALPLISETTTCSNEPLKYAKLPSGIHVRLSLSSPELTYLSETCCECCLLGKAAQELHLPCDHSLSLGYQCGLVSRACCMDGASLNDTLDFDKENGTISGDDGDEVKAVEPCKDNGKCAHLCVGNGTCTCFKGYKLKPNGISCDDINECLLGASDCRGGERCINTEGSFRCQRVVSCGTGYELTDSNHCKDIDECETATHNCVPDFECHNTQGSFRCHPKVKYINECLAQTGPCHPGQVCINSLGSYTCQRNSVNCGRGYHLNTGGTRCVDGACSGHGCINLVGSFRCECASGYVFNSLNRVCEDINECRHYPGSLCAHKCENNLGSYSCSCTTGFKLAADGRHCTDLNECESNPCSQECANVYGSYQCYCRRGYQLSDVDGMTCEDIDECALPTGGHICSYRCHNTAGSFHCSCPATGYTLAGNGRNCQDFRCLSYDCPTNYRRIGETTETIARSGTIRCMKSCLPNDVACARDPVHSVSDTFISMATRRDFSIPEEIVFLRTTVSAYGSYQFGSYDVMFEIQDGNEDRAFDVVKRVENGVFVADFLNADGDDTESSALQGRQEPGSREPAGLCSQRVIPQYCGVVRQVKPIIGPLNLVLKLAMINLTSQGASHQNVINIHISVSEFWF
ncbi:hypothetical protein NHX12_002509 [Muraenolepis orangiensis]|uniref:Fibulin-1 n=1 Tax=Muraenolepis orangiensis TaxID=630683 RepID=A0A9Q0DWB2_9TELE|nr:hypothetical protein NHX12_002509 [Muraenolepis orangiensis]